MIVDFHAHIFPPAVIDKRERYVARDGSFAALYKNPTAKLASARDLLGSMERAGVDVTVAQSFAWESADLCREHNDYLLAAAADSDRRIKAFCSVQAANASDAIAEAMRVKELGASGLGELRPEGQGYDLGGEAGETLARLSRELELPLLFHVSEPVGHDYPGKQGLPMADFYAFVKAHPDCNVIGAHWAGGLPLYGVMPELADELDNVWFDTAATTLLYDDAIYERAVETMGADRIVFASDFPLLNQKKQLERVRELKLDQSAVEGIVGGNAARLLGL